MKNLLVCTLVIVFTFGCARYAGIDTSVFEIGMKKPEILFATENRAKPIGSKRYEHGVVEVLEVDRLSHWDSTVVERYWLYFLNGTLEQWGRPGDWRKEADRIYEIRYR